MNFNKIFKFVIAICLLYSLVACANNPLSSYLANMNTSLEQFKSGNIAGATNSMRNSNKILYYLEQATLMRMSGKYIQSNNFFIQAQQVIDAWITSYHNTGIGITTDTLTTSLVNDKAVDYVPKDYEKVMVPTYKSLNYFNLGEIDNARVEITRMYNIEDIIQNFQMAKYDQFEHASKSNQTTTKDYVSFAQFSNANANKYNFTVVNSPQVVELKNSYQNAFSHYLAGYLFEALGEPSLAHPGYLRALKLNPGNSLIKTSINNLDKGIIPDGSTSDVLVIEEIGHAPQLKSVSLPVPFITKNAQDNACVSAVTIALPEIVPDQTIYGNIMLSVDGALQHPQLFTNFNLMAARYLHDNLPNIFLRNLLRAAKDVTLQQSACNNGGSIMGLLATISSVVLGSADERTWVTLPEKIYITRLKLKRGNHSLQIKTLNGNKDVTIKLTKAYQIISFRVVGSSIYVQTET